MKRFRQLMACKNCKTDKRTVKKLCSVHAVQGGLNCSDESCHFPECYRMATSEHGIYCFQHNHKGTNYYPVVCNSDTLSSCTCSEQKEPGPDWYKVCYCCKRMVTMQTIALKETHKANVCYKCARQRTFAILNDLWKGSSVVAEIVLSYVYDMPPEGSFVKIQCLNVPGQVPKIINGTIENIITSRAAVIYPDGLSSFIDLGQIVHVSIWPK